MQHKEQHEPKKKSYGTIQAGIFVWGIIVPGVLMTLTVLVIW